MKPVVPFVTLVAFLLTGCQPILREVRHPGGYPGYLMDKRTFDASRSKDVQLLRAAIVLAMTSRMATATVKDGKDADAFVDYLGAAADELNYTAADIYNVGNTPPCTLRENGEAGTACGAYYAMFEADIPLLESRITRLMLAALPENRARKFLTDIGKGNILSAAWSAIRGIYEATGGLHRASGVYRGGLELVASNLSCTTAFDQAKGTVWDAAECLGLSHDEFFNSPNELKGEDLRIRVKRDAFHALMLVAKGACARLPITSGAGSTDLAEQLQRRNDTCGRVKFEPQYRPMSLR